MPKGFVLSDKVLNNKLNSPAYNSKYSYAADKSLNDLDISSFVKDCFGYPLFANILNTFPKIDWYVPMASIIILL